MEHSDISKMLRDGELYTRIVVHMCDMCKDEIYENYECFQFENGDIICEDCLGDYFSVLEKRARRIANVKQKRA